jgi:hypothetical protein
MYLRDVVEEPRYSEDLDHYRRLYSAIDDVQAIISWTLSRQPTIGQPLLVAPDFRVFTTSPFQDMPAFWVLYTFDTERVYLHSIQVAQ